mmetsp:Transcript_31614/g.89808  ORF Transcript_31614/g.89808 Transcript_31614/m.89808 type:complete len:126 (-) Transcript_31614:525-902(-)
MQQYLDAAGAPPSVILTNADPGSTAAVAEVLPKTRGAFLSEFIRAQIQISETVFRCEYEALQHHWAVVVPYSEDQLMPNIRYWVGLRFDGFMTGSISMQRGEGPNRFKQDILGSLPTSSTYTKRS